MKKVFFSFDRNPVGIVFRVFVLKESQLPERIAMVKIAIDKALSIVTFDKKKPAFKRITVLVPSDTRYPSCDCGKTADLLRCAYASEKRVEILEVMGDLFCSALNFAVAKQAADGMDYSLIASPDAHAYLTSHNVFSMFQKAEIPGTRIVGLALHELSDSIHNGYIANTFALWHIESLQAVGMFNIPISGEPKSDKEAVFLSGLDEKGNEVFYKINGVEEIVPALLIQDHVREPFIGIVDPVEGEYEVVSDPDLIKRHQAKMATKAVRQQHQAFKIGYQLHNLKYAVMK